MQKSPKKPSPSRKTETPKKLSGYDFFRSISETKENLLRTHPGAAKLFSPHVATWYLAHFPDCIMTANRANAMWEMTPVALYEYLLGAIKKKRRNFKHKKKEDDRTKIIMEYYDCSERYAEQILRLFSEKDIDILRDLLEERARGKNL